MGAKSCDIRVRMSVCLIVRMPACNLHISKTTFTNFTKNFLYMLPVAVARSSSHNNAVFYVLPVFLDLPCLQVMGLIYPDPPGGAEGEVCYRRLPIECVVAWLDWFFLFTRPDRPTCNSAWINLIQI